ncbi:MAG: hypothetical protein SGJ20_22320 [Planctomycetota bacterium]|nr:hypothetical protein [Planctomycetota bacterium]
MRVWALAFYFSFLSGSVFAADFTFKLKEIRTTGVQTATADMPVTINGVSTTLKLNGKLRVKDGENASVQVGQEFDAEVDMLEAVKQYCAAQYAPQGNLVFEMPRHRFYDYEPVVILGVAEVGHGQLAAPKDVFYTYYHKGNKYERSHSCVE